LPVACGLGFRPTHPMREAWPRVEPGAGCMEKHKKREFYSEQTEQSRIWAEILGLIAWIRC
jgi:hypothetical protein